MQYDVHPLQLYLVQYTLNKFLLKKQQIVEIVLDGNCLVLSFWAKNTKFLGRF
jgi:hypothetical protein